VNDDNTPIVASVKSEAAEGYSYNWGNDERKQPVATGTDHTHVVKINIDRAKFAPRSVKMRYIIKIK
jgi:hypothetical protein